MSEINVTAMEPGWYGVQIEEGHLRTSRRVRVPEDLFDSGLPEADPERLVRESIAFLLEREPATAIAEDLSLVQIADAFPDYPTEIRRRVGG